MAAKRALVVDDSKSARTFLAKMLEKYELEVVSVESAEQAIEHLAHHRPDVIFMDHLMPGMDGFQAVQAIKNNPRTATIPIMMYTSQEGELYLGQARALGAVGVLPKQIKPADVSKVLYQLHLLPDRRSSEAGAFRPLGASSVEIIEDGETTAPVARPATELAVREQIAELRRSLIASLDDHTERLRGEVRAALLETATMGRDGGLAPRRSTWAWIAVLSGLVAAACLVAAGWQAARSRTLAGELTELRAGLVSSAARAGSGPSTPGVLGGAGAAGAAQNAEAGPRNGAAGDPDDGAALAGRAASGAGSGPGARALRTGASSTAVQPLVEVVPYGDDPLGGPRLDSLRQLFDRLVAQGYRGTVEVKIFPGRFCLIGDPTDGYSPAPDATPYARCDLVGPLQSGLEAAAPQRVPVAFADMAGELRSASHGAIDVQVLAGDERSTLVAYPPISDSLTAGEWNRAATANNRIEIRLR